ncbi:NAD-dependent epimerase/dehydratase family protein [Parvularcula oceani]|uniref:NAD-dependent epimerase/dehydratase family protein n=1 Tax=Parvularcula oceani TaxID=1247963 RepID=UPI0004E11D9B|nr:NAD-dependent epimerase/dehydratase family protein [Parvularcula oceani]
MRVLVTGTAGFIGSYVSSALLARGNEVLGVDNLNAYYDPALKEARLAALEGQPGFSFRKLDIAEDGALEAAAGAAGIDRIVHLAAQAGVRYSIENPSAYVRANLSGHARILEFARDHDIAHTVYASSSSVYGGNTKVPFSEDDVTDDPVSFYGATKKSDELLSNSYARLYGLPMTGLRFFTVYGPQGRPDMAYWIFSEKILKGEPIRLFNQGQMGRDFTYIDDIVAGVVAALDRPPSGTPPHRVYNLGNDSPQELMEMVGLLERHLGREAEKRLEPMQAGDVERTWADISRARKELGYDPKTSLDEGLERFARWFLDHAGQRHG